MRFNRLALVCSLALAGCLGNVDSSSQRIVTGKVATKDYKLDNAVIIAESSDHRVFVTHLMRDGSFKLQLPPNVAYRLTLANSTRTGAYVSVARLNWPLTSGTNRWAKLGAGAKLDLGHVYKRGSTQWGIQCSGCSGGSSGSEADKSAGDCHEDDKAHCDKSSNENDCDSDHKADSNDNCDKDDDADKHDSECDKDDQDKHDGYGDGGDKGGDDDHGGSCGCSNGADGGAGGTGGSGGGSGAGAGGMCAMNVDCATGLDCVASVCTTPSTSM